MVGACHVGQNPTQQTPTSEGGLFINEAFEDLYIFKRPKYDFRTAAEMNRL